MHEHGHAWSVLHLSEIIGECPTMALNGASSALLVLLLSGNGLRAREGGG